MKTYNTIEDILNDHELMAQPLNLISACLDLLPDSEYIKIPQSLHALYPKSDWLKSEYERRQREKKFVFENTPCDIQDFRNRPLKFKESDERKYPIKPMEKKPNLIPFDLEKAKAGAKVWQGKTNPKEVKIISDKGVGKYSIIALIDLQNGGETVGRFTVEGFHIVNEKNESLDLFIESEPLPEMWVNVYKEDDFYCGVIHKTKEKALMVKNEFYFGTAKLVFE